MTLRDGWRTFAGAAMLALVLTLGFSRESYGLWPVFTVLDFPGQLGRALAFLLGQGQAPSLVLGPTPDQRLGGSAPVEMLAGALGLAFTLGAGAFCLYLAPRERLRSPVLLATSALLLLGGMWPPYAYLRTPAPLIAGAALGALALPALAPQAERTLAFLAGCFLLAPLWQMREPLFVSGAPGTDLALLERGSGIPATAWAVLGLALAGGMAMKWVGRASATASTPTSNATPTPTA